MILLLLACAGTGSIDPVVVDDSGGPVSDDSAAPPDPRCELPATLAGGDFVEGDEVVVDLSCATGEPGFEFAGLDLPAGATLTEAQLRWTTGLDQAGRHTLFFTAHNGEGLPETASLQVDIADAWDDRDNEPVDPALYVEEMGLPVLHLDPRGSVGDSYVDATITFEGHSYSASMKKRGAASSYYPKVGYTLDFETEQLDLSDFDMGNKAHLVLISTFDDNSYVRQKLAYDVWAAMAAHSGEERLTPRTFFVVVYLDGVYHGLYVACDHIDDEFFQQFGFDRASDVYKAVSHDANFYNTDANGNQKYSWHQGYEQKEGTSWDALDSLVEYAASTGSQDFVDSASDWIVPEEFMDWFIFVHFLAADDSAGKNCYLYYDPATGQMRFVPWDFNHAWGQTWQTDRESSSSYNDYNWNNRIFYHQQRRDGDRLWARWFDYLDGPLSEPALIDLLDSYYAQIDPAARRDWDKWGSQYRSYSGWSWRNNWTDYDGERDYLYQWVRERVEWGTTDH